MKRKNEYILTLPFGILRINFEAISEDGINLIDEEVNLLCDLDYLTQSTISIQLPDGTELELNSIGTALVEFRCGYYLFPEWMKQQTPQNEMDALELAKNIFSKFYPDIMKKFPTLLDSVPSLKYKKTVSFVD